MASQVEICNQALTKAGAARIVSLLDDTESARVLSAIYGVKLDAELAAQPWTFAIKRAQLPASSTAPVFGWRYQYPLPADFILLCALNDNPVAQPGIKNGAERVRNAIADVVLALTGPLRRELGWIRDHAGPVWDGVKRAASVVLSRYP